MIEQQALIKVANLHRLSCLKIQSMKMQMRHTCNGDRRAILENKLKTELAVKGMYEDLLEIFYRILNPSGKWWLLQQ